MDCVTDLRVQRCRDVAAGVGDDKLVTRRELACLPPLLAEGEQVETMAAGGYHAGSWLLVLTNRRLLLLHKGLFGAFRQQAIAFGEITAISSRFGLSLIATLRIDAGGRRYKMGGMQGNVAAGFVQAVSRAMPR